MTTDLLTCRDPQTCVCVVATDLKVAPAPDYLRRPNLLAADIATLTVVSGANIIQLVIAIATAGAEAAGAALAAPPHLA